MKRIIFIILCLLSTSAIAVTQPTLKLSQIAPGGNYNPATDVFVTVRNGVQDVLTSILFSGGMIDPRNYGAACPGAAYGGHDDTAAFEAAAAVAQPLGLSVMVPQGCWVSGLKVPSGTSMMGQGWAPNYGYVSSGTLPKLYCIGHPSYCIDINGQNNLAFLGFEVNAFQDGAAMTSTGCIGSASGGGFGPKIWLFNMSMKGCKVGFGQPTLTGGEIFAVAAFSDFGANNIGVGGKFSDFFSIGNTYVSGAAGTDFVESPGGFYRFYADRFEYLTNGFVGSGAGGTSGSSFEGVQFDHMAQCAISISSDWLSINITGGTVRAPGLAGSLQVLGAANNGSGIIRLTVGSDYGSVGNCTSCSTGGLVTGDVVKVSGITGTTEANGTWTLTVIDGTHIDLQSSAFVNAYTSGGQGAVNNKAAAICLAGSNNGGFAGRDLHVSNEMFLTDSGEGGINPAPSYIIDASTSGANNDWISFDEGQAQPAPSAAYYPAGGYMVAFANWQVSIPPHLRINTAGPQYFDDFASFLSYPTTDTTANGSLGLGLGALSAQTPNSAAYFNTAIGYHAGHTLSFSTSVQNTFFGASAGAIANSADDVGIGYNSLTALGAGFNDTAVGANSGKAVTSGNDNTIFGFASCFVLTTGSNNLCLGYQAGFTNLKTGSNNILIQAGGVADTPANATSNFFDLNGWIRADMAGSDLEFHGTSAVPALATGSSDCGTSPLIAGNNKLGRLVVGSSTNGGKCTITFANSLSYATNPICQVHNETSEAISPYVPANDVHAVVTQTTLAITANGGTLNPGDNLTWNCEGYF